jgi:hypothetical protein
MDAQSLFEGRHGMPRAGAGINEIEQVLGVLLVFWGYLHGGVGSIRMKAGTEEIPSALWEGSFSLADRSSAVRKLGGA